MHAYGCQWVGVSGGVGGRGKPCMHSYGYQWVGVFGGVGAEGDSVCMRMGVSVCVFPFSLQPFSQIGLRFIESVKRLPWVLFLF